MSELYRKLLALLDSEGACAVATIVDSAGSIPNDVGAQMLVDARGELVAGTVGGGQVEFEAMKACRSAIESGEHTKYTCHLTDVESGGLGMMCGGRAEIFIQVYQPASQLVLVGAGHINLALARIARGLNFSVTVIDDRKQWANAENYPGCRCINLEPEQAYAEISWRDDAFLVIGNRDRDLPALRAALSLPCRYIGLVASKRKALTIIGALRDEGLDLEASLERLYAPIGLDTGGATPSDIAVSIIAEVQQIRHGRGGGHLKLSEALLKKGEKAR